MEFSSNNLEGLGTRQLNSTKYLLSFGMSRMKQMCEQKLNDVDANNISAVFLLE